MGCRFGVNGDVAVGVSAVQISSMGSYHFPKGTTITSDPHYLAAVAAEIKRPTP
ncbi:hypothetical protein GCM10027436_05580 [Actinophytocola sediminis]